MLSTKLSTAHLEHRRLIRILDVADDGFSVIPGRLVDEVTLQEPWRLSAVEALSRGGLQDLMANVLRAVKQALIAASLTSLPAT